MIGEQDIIQLEQKAWGLRDSLRRLTYERDHRSDNPGEASRVMRASADRMIEELLDELEIIDRVTFNWRKARMDEDA
ncbi:MAG: hypothetical protein V4636_13045 [Pseudomonadota bacterium]